VPGLDLEDLAQLAAGPREVLCDGDPDLAAPRERGRERERDQPETRRT
jgi:hypothetical protein